MNSPGSIKKPGGARLSNPHAFMRFFCAVALIGLFSEFYCVGATL